MIADIGVGIGVPPGPFPGVTVGLLVDFPFGLPVEFSGGLPVAVSAGFLLGSAGAGDLWDVEEADSPPLSDGRAAESNGFAAAIGPTACLDWT